MSESVHNAIFLSYAREDAASCRNIAEALRAANIEVWFAETLFFNLYHDPRWASFLRKIGRAPEQAKKIRLDVTIPPA
jgi:hypothetical protein